MIAHLKEKYPPGTKICLDRMGVDPRPIPPGTKGEVISVDDIGTVHCRFGNGRQPGLVYREDFFHKIAPLTLIGHSMGETQKLRNVQEVANFIIKHGVEGDVSVTFENTRPFLSTCGIYLNDITDMEYREELLKVLIPILKCGEHCEGCAYAQKCEYSKMRARLRMGDDIVICNQNMLVAHLINGGIFNASVATFIIDEAHNLEPKFRDAYTESYGKSDILGILHASTARHKYSKAVMKLAKQIEADIEFLFADMNAQIYDQQSVFAEIVEKIIVDVETLTLM